MPKLLKWQEAEIKRIEELGHTALVDELILLMCLADGLNKRQDWIAGKVEEELRHRLQIFYDDDFDSHFIRWLP